MKSQTWACPEYLYKVDRVGNKLDCSYCADLVRFGKLCRFWEGSGKNHYDAFSVVERS